MSAFWIYVCFTTSTMNYEVPVFSLMLISFLLEFLISFLKGKIYYFSQNIKKISDWNKLLQFRLQYPLREESKLCDRDSEV